jgi:hypothetical protein
VPTALRWIRTVRAWPITSSSCAATSRV